MFNKRGCKTKEVGYQNEWEQMVSHPRGTEETTFQKHKT